jgi:hypothetical protein
MMDHAAVIDRWVQLTRLYTVFIGSEDGGGGILAKVTNAITCIDLLVNVRQTTPQ